MDDEYRLSQYDYDLPPELIAQHPMARRDMSRLMILNRKTGAISHTRFDAIGDHLHPGDVLVLNDTKVIRARMWGRRASGGKIEALVVRRREDGLHEVLIKPSARLKLGERVVFENGEIGGRLHARTDEGGWVVEFEHAEQLDRILEKAGRMPLPPYIKRTYPQDDYADEDAERYQTVYARAPGAIAAPTAGLHFTEALLGHLKSKGIVIEFITLHVGLGTFRPIKTDDIRAHKMDAEYFEITRNAADAIRAAKCDGRRIVAVGTTACRSIETAGESGEVRPGGGWTEKFIYPPYRFRIVDALVTNFHLPKSTLLLLVSAFAGREMILRAYREAIEKKYRFYSYGDAMLIL
ncbi:MAG: tRNA preQ1(34) S-adenosylmethionine ribosyltransferase-isomerase QueA [Planctomycetota bacterium]